MLRKLLRWLIRAIFGRRYEYYELGDGKYLKVERGTAEIITLDAVPQEVRRDRETVDSRLLDALDASSRSPMGTADRLSILKQLPAFAILEKAVTNSLVRNDVLEKPALVDADSALEAQFKLDLVEGKDITTRIEATPDVTEADVEAMLDTEFLLKWGYNTFGDDLADTLNTGEVDDGTAASKESTATRDSDSAAEYTPKVDTSNRQGSRIPKATETPGQPGNSATTSTTASTTNAVADGNSVAGSPSGPAGSSSPAGAGGGSSGSGSSSSSGGAGGGGGGGSGSSSGSRGGCGGGSGSSGGSSGGSRGGSKGGGNG